MVFLTGKARLGCQASILLSPPEEFLRPGEGFPSSANLRFWEGCQSCRGLHFARRVAGVHSGPMLHVKLETLARPEALTHSPSSVLRVPACTHNGKTYSHGEVWHPTVLSFGPMPCILCTCMDGYQDCHRVTCPTQYPCSQPKKVAGKCCKTCPGRREAEGQGRHCPGGLGALGPSVLTLSHRTWGLHVFYARSSSTENARLL